MNEAFFIPDVTINLVGWVIAGVVTALLLASLWTACMIVIKIRYNRRTRALTRNGVQEASSTR